MNTHFTSRLLAVGLIVSLLFLQMPHAFADDEVSTSTDSAPTAVVDPAPISNDSTSTSEIIPDVVPTSTPTLATSTPTTGELNASNTPDLGTTTSEIGDVGSSTPTLATSTDPLASISPSLGTTTISADIGTSTGTSTIATGDGLSQGNITNSVNTNVVNSDATLSVLNHVSDGDGNIDLRKVSDGGSSCTSCTISTSTLASNPAIDASSTNNATISNVVVVRANTGDNTSSSTNALIQTGNAYSTANVVNVANTNIIDSSYLLLILNNFGTINGDIVLPTADFFNQFLQASTTYSNSTNPLSLTTSNTANVSNNASTTANTGNNFASTTNSSLIATGNAYSGSTVINDVNQTSIGNNSVGLIFNIFGNWTGQAFNLPTGFSAQTTPTGVQFVYLAPSSSSTTQGNNQSYNLTQTNTASISNNISVDAQTGNNSVEGNNGTIMTGNAYADANVVNVANTTIIGSNWLHAIINIFGNLNGNISFGQPDLWVGTTADFSGGNAGAGGEVTFHYTIKNNGDAPAHNVVLTHTPDSSLISLDKNEPLDIGTLAPGEIREFDQVAHIAPNLPGGDTSIANTISVQAVESDGNIQDNTDTISVVVHGIQTFFGPVNYDPVLHGIPANFSITKSNSATHSLAASSSVDYTINIKNVGGYADHALLHDEIKNSAGEVIHTEDWDLDSVDSQEEITVSYTAFFNASTTLGTYTNSAQILSADGSFPDSVIASTSIEIASTAPIVPLLTYHKKVLGASIAYAAAEQLSEEKATTTASSTIQAMAGMLTNSTLTSNQYMALALNAAKDVPYWLWLLVLMISMGVYVSPRERKMS